MTNPKGGKHARPVNKKKKSGLKIALIAVASLLVILVAAGALLIDRISNPRNLFTPEPIARTPVPDAVSDAGTADATQEPDVPAIASTEEPGPTEVPTGTGISS